MSERLLKVVLPVVILAGGFIIAVVLIKSRAPAPTRPARQYAPVVRTFQAKAKDHVFIVRTQGTVKPRTETTLVCEVSGRVVWVSPAFAAGGFFERGEVLVELDARDYELAEVAARGDVARARVRLEMEEAQAEVAREEWRQLGEGEESPLATRELQVQEAQATLAAAEAVLERAKRDLARTKIRGPFAGRVREKHVDVGQYVAPGTSVADVFAVDYAEVRLPIPDDDLAYLDLPVDYRGEKAQKIGPEVRLSADFAGARHRWLGRVVRVEGEIDPVSRMVHVVAQVEDPYGQAAGASDMPLAVGLFVEAEITGRAVTGVFSVPRAALRGDDTLLIIDDDGRLRFRGVEVLRVGEDYVIVGNGLHDGERVCVSTFEAITDGMKVRTMDGSEGSDSLTVEAAGGTQQ